MTTTDKEHLKFIYNRMTKIYGVDENTDYMLRFKEIIEQSSREEIIIINIDKIEYLELKQSVHNIVAEIAKINIKYINDLDDNLTEDLKNVSLRSQLVVKKMDNILLENEINEKWKYKINIKK